jgi:hypothetical protein
MPWPQQAHLDLHVGFRLLVAHGDIAARERDVVQIEPPRRRSARSGQLEGPVVATIGKTLRIDGRIHEIDCRNHDVVRDERQHGNLEVDLVERGEMRVVGPVGVGNLDLRGGKTRPGHPGAPAGFAGRPAPAHLKIAFDREGPPDSLAHLFVHVRLRVIPVEQENEADQGRNQHDDKRDEPCDDPGERAPEAEGLGLR